MTSPGPKRVKPIDENPIIVQYLGELIFPDAN